MLLATISTAAGITLALNHPLWPMGMLVLLWCVFVLEFGVPGAWLLLVPACLPFMNFSIWTGWIAFEELDIVLLAALAGGYGRRVFFRDSASANTDSSWGLTHLLWYALAATGAVSLARGVADAGGWSFDWFAGYDHTLNSVRVFKSLGFALALWPLLVQQLREDSALAHRRFAWGMVIGLACVSLSVVWERAGFVGLWNFSSNYRTVALFWEMHVGGAAIDAYLALTVPFSVWALVTAKRPTIWVAAAALVLLVGYACLTTFSRGVYLAVLCALVLLAYLVHRQTDLTKPTRVRWHFMGGVALVILLGMEILAVLGGDSFMQQRIAKSGQDMGSRIKHWQHGVELLHSTPDWWLGKGLGRLPANYSASVEGENFSGDASLRAEIAESGNFNRFVTLRTPPNLNSLPGLYSLTQRVQLVHDSKKLLRMDVRVRDPVELAVQLCQRHLLYDRDCQWDTVHVEPREGDWQSLEVPLQGPPLVSDPGIPSRLLTFAVSVDTPGSEVDIDNLKLTDAMGQELQSNGDFSHQLAQWLPAAQFYFVPWHIDNLYLELLIERGWLGVLVFGTLVAWALGCTVWPRKSTNPTSPYLAAGLLGALVVGLVSSFLDVPRVALLFYLLPMMLIGCKNRTIK